MVYVGQTRLDRTGQKRYPHLLQVVAPPLRTRHIRTDKLSRNARHVKAMIDSVLLLLRQGLHLLIGRSLLRFRARDQARHGFDVAVSRRQLAGTEPDL